MIKKSCCSRFSLHKFIHLKFFRPNSKTCTCEVHAARGCVSRGLTVYIKIKGYDSLEWPPTWDEEVPPVPPCEEVWPPPILASLAEAILKSWRSRIICCWCWAINSSNGDMRCGIPALDGAVEVAPEDAAVLWLFERFLEFDPWSV